MELRIKLSVFIVFLFFSSCGDPVNADKNIIKVRLVEGFEMFNENNENIFGTINQKVVQADCRE